MKEELLKTREDERGKLVEVFKVPGFGQVFFSISKPGVVRGNHYHKRKVEKFCVIEGEAEISLRNRQTEELKSYLVSGKKPQVVPIPVNHAHNIINVGNSEMKLLVWANEIFDPKDSDTFSEQV